MSNSNYLTPSALNKYLAEKFLRDKNIKNLYVKGEISNYVKQKTGNIFFKIKDSQSSLDCFMFARNANIKEFDIKDGDSCFVSGEINIWVNSGKYVLTVSNIEKEGLGKEYEKYLEYKKKLKDLGYFDIDKKKKIPEYPNVIGVVTSPTGAVIEDIKTTVSRRYRLAKIYLYPTNVQGETAHFEIAKQIIKANIDKKVDVLIVGRGGGSFEDLNCFNKEEVVMAIYNSKIPVITAIGHETDNTISDDISDRRAATPTAAAEIATKDCNILYKNIEQFRQKILEQTKFILNSFNYQLIDLENKLSKKNPTLQVKENYNIYNQLVNKFKNNFNNVLAYKLNSLKDLYFNLKKPNEIYQRSIQVYESLLNRLNVNIKNIVSYNETIYNKNIDALNILSPYKLLEKGYVLLKKDNKVITSINDINISDNIELELLDGYIKSSVYGKDKKNGK